MKKRQRNSLRKKYRMRRAFYGMNFYAETKAPETAPEGAPDEALAKEAKEAREELEKERADKKERLLRARADMENLRKRLERDRKEIVKFANETLISNLLPVLDNFEHAWKAAEKNPDFDSFKKGIELIHQQFMKALSDSGLERIDADDQDFNPRFHDAVTTDHDAEKPDNHVLEVIRDGYVYKNRVIRPAMVRVNKAPREAEKAASGGGVKPNPLIRPQPLSQEEAQAEKEGRLKEAPLEKDGAPEEKTAEENPAPGGKRKTPVEELQESLEGALNEEIKETEDNQNE